MKFSHTHGITEYSTTVVLIYVITIPKWRTAAILDSGKNSHDFAQD